VRESLLNAIRGRPTGLEVKQFLSVAGFLGKTTYSDALKSLGDYVKRIPQRLQKYPTAGPRIAFGTIVPYPKQTIANLKKEKLRELNELVSGVVDAQRDPGAIKKWKAQDIDCFLYAQDNNYK